MRPSGPWVHGHPGGSRSAVAEASRLSTCGQDARATAGKMPALHRLFLAQAAKELSLALGSRPDRALREAEEIHSERSFAEVLEAIGTSALDVLLNLRAVVQSERAQQVQLVDFL